MILIKKRRQLCVDTVRILKYDLVWSASFSVCSSIIMNRSRLIALGIIVAIGLYLLSGLIGRDTSEPDLSNSAAVEETLMSVRVKNLEAEELAREIVLFGKTAPSRFVDIRAEVEGRIEFVLDGRGRFVEAGELIARVEERDRPERLRQALANKRQAGLEHQSAKRLHAQGMLSDAELAQRESALRAAEQMVKALEIDLNKLEIVAPFDGYLEERLVETGDFIRLGDRIGRIIDLEPLIVTAEATEFQRNYLKRGEVGHARLSSGETLDGVLRYVGSEADINQRTFTVELELPNQGSEVPAGFSSEIVVETERVQAYRISPALVSISDEGTFGIKVVDEEDRVQFYEADIVKTSPEYIWITGLPEHIRLITFGQGFVKSGDRVQVQLDTGDWN